MTEIGVELDNANAKGCNSNYRTMSLGAGKHVKNIQCVNTLNTL